MIVNAAPRLATILCLVDDNQDSNCSFPSKIAAIQTIEVYAPLIRQLQKQMYQ